MALVISNGCSESKHCGNGSPGSPWRAMHSQVSASPIVCGLGSKLLSGFSPRLDSRNRRSLLITSTDYSGNLTVVPLEANCTPTTGFLLSSTGGVNMKTVISYL